MLEEQFDGTLVTDQQNFKHFMRPMDHGSSLYYAMKKSSASLAL
jgi:hypothetical protein